MIYFLYGAILYPALLLTSPYLAWKLMTRPKHRAGFWQKMGYFLPRQTRRTIWIHAVSVGETLAAVELARELGEATKDYRIVFSTTTPTGQDIARKKLTPMANVVYFPYPLPGAARRAVRALNPAAVALVDSDLWPNMIGACVKHGAKVAVVNGRISDRSFPRYRRFYWLFRHVLADVSLFLMQSELDGERIIEMGADPARVDAIGALKYDQRTEPVSDEQKIALRRSIGAGADEKIVLLGSVHPGEEAAIRAALGAAKQIDGLRVVIAPRHFDDIGWIEKTLENFGARAVRKSKMNPAEPNGGAAVPVIDTFGELARLYAIADVAYVGGSMIRRGGQNPLEPAAHGAPCLFGPDMSNFREIARALREAGGAWTVESEEEMTARLVTLLGGDAARERAGQAARSAVEKSRGVTKKTAARILAMIDE